MSKNMFKWVLFALVITVIFSVVGCDDDDNNDEDIGEHIMPWGFVLYDSGVEVVRYFKGTYTGEIEVHESGMTGHIAVHFLDADSVKFDPADEPGMNEGHHHLEITIQDTSIAGLYRHDQGGGEDWGFHITGEAVGQTGLHLSLRHEDHYGFQMPSDVWIPIHVEHESGGEHGPPVGLVVKEEDSGTILATATAATVTGEIIAPIGDHTDHLVVEFFDAENRYFQPGVPVHSLMGTVADSTIAQFESHADDGEPWSFWIIGEQAGQTTLELDLMHDDHIGWGDALPIPVIVQ